ncbi:transcriptional regulator, TetR family [Micromonospora pattaloongensis]|uniref:Transcriptional regulator, TetR family n=1 Tax=Micromonospora pattaloongensis TaxID=405436 RepID=A0A1H3RZX9_9ACTN|nr:TetR/AcrR family transcriptional regulator [Micromonospora pattaloongensis]SDZ30459.1 transcriptional regulator, TetR family [Micromonospora pattaloongensis]
MPTRGEDTRARIVTASAALFARQGYHGTGLSELLDAVGLGKGGLYHHIASKEQLLLEIMLEPIDRVLASSDRILAADTDATTKLRALGDDLGQAMAADLSAWTVFLREYSALGQDGKTQVLGRRQAYLDRWRRVLIDGAASGEFRPIDLAFVESILGLFIYTFVWARDDTPAQELTNSIMGVLMHGICTPTRSA